jgi:hypothetical protein
VKTSLDTTADISEKKAAPLGRRGGEFWEENPGRGKQPPTGCCRECRPGNPVTQGGLIAGP